MTSLIRSMIPIPEAARRPIADLLGELRLHERVDGVPSAELLQTDRIERVPSSFAIQAERSGLGGQPHLAATRGAPSGQSERFVYSFASSESRTESSAQQQFG
jgi:hypothetical protein